MVPESAQKEWQRAGLELSQRISSWRKPDRDCRDLLVEVSKAGALVTITTRDGRQAYRAIAKPNDLTPVASALAVSVVDIAPRAEPEPPAPAHDAPPADTAMAAAPSLTIAHQAVLGVVGGTRIGSPGGFVSPLVRGLAGLDVGSWELGVFADFAPHHWLLNESAPSNFSMWSMGAGVALGVRQPLGAIELIGGLAWGASFITEKSTEYKVDETGVESKDHKGEGVDPEVGAYVGFVVPRRLGLRLRSQLELDLPLSHPFQTRELDSDLPSIPGWNVSAVVGAEIGIP